MCFFYLRGFRRMFFKLFPPALVWNSLKDGHLWQAGDGGRISCISHVFLLLRVII
ncbi:unnamed protein product [Tuber melanosporum]|uniref:(Perigord truffle) hypothetical protein n=1 Tax=Tuber melanosporum (strain Mel28) TaxID=656061 RepID=D5G6S0_TUBMM|nr:uncharacterized protein GSTUM_00002241001 [Tuber melanosporum]CAZ80213.1 unnamed protein product [Tuber melanosporum]